MFEWAYNLETVFKLLILFQIKHYVCDFLLQREYILKKSVEGMKFLLPLSLHCFIHSTLTLFILLSVNASLWHLALFDFFAHFVMDRIKSGPLYLGRFHDMTKKSYWNCLGFDQMVHHLTHYFIIWSLVSSLA